MSAETHDLVVTEDGNGRCSCGDTFDGPPEDAVEAWTEHTDLTRLLVEARESALRERTERAHGETAILRLLDHGLSARTISEAIGTDERGTLMVSSTLVQRLGRDAHVTSPRRRRRNGGPT